ncbi:MAG: alpha/beta hydrolase [Bryobacteraceae bacterium]|nr:alpha/beta hydrolase [Bryobacteraceae bacterium]
MRFSLLLFISCALAFGAVEEGEVNGAKFRILKPDNWNGSLVMFCHGYSSNPSIMSADYVVPFTSRGYAVAMSSYSKGGWATAEGVEDTEALRLEFIRRHGAPKETWVSGVSMGGHITLLTIEQKPAVYDGALPLCGANQSDHSFLSEMFANRAVFDYFFPDVLPPLDKVPADYRATRAAGEAAAKLAEGNTAGVAAMRRLTGFSDIRQVMGAMLLTTEIIGDIQRRAGGNPFDNRAVLYDDPALQKGVKRYAADEKASAWLLARYQFRGVPMKPVLALQKTMDGLVSSRATNFYPALAAQNGSSRYFVQQYVEGTGHCTFQPAQIGAAFDALREWKSTGKQPPAGLIDTQMSTSAGSGARP